MVIDLILRSKGIRKFIYDCYVEKRFDDLYDFLITIETEEINQ